MPQSLIQLPKEADIIAGYKGTLLSIRNHKVVPTGTLFEWILRLIWNHNSWGNAVTLMEKKGLMFEAVIECCVRELEDDTGLLARVGLWDQDIWYAVNPPDNADANYAFSESDAGRNIAAQLIDKIRSCNDWEQLRSEMNHTSGFYQDLKVRYIKEWEQRHGPPVYGKDCFNYVEKTTGYEQSSKIRKNKETKK